MLIILFYSVRVLDVCWLIGWNRLIENPFFNFRCYLLGSSPMYVYIHPSLYKIMACSFFIFYHFKGLLAAAIVYVNLFFKKRKLLTISF
jgi:hypothetical protein